MAPSPVSSPARSRPRDEGELAGLVYSLTENPRDERDDRVCRGAAAAGITTDARREAGASMNRRAFLTRLPPARMAMLRKLLPPSGAAATFEDATLRVGTVTLPDARMMCLFNWDDRPQTLAVGLPAAAVTDYWTGESLGRRQRTLSIEMAPRSARLLKGVS